MQGSLSFEEHLRRARDCLRLEKAAHAATRAKLLQCEAELAQVKGLGGRPMEVDVETGGPSDPLHGDIHMSPVAGDAGGAKGAVPADVPPDAVVEEPAQSAERTHSAHADPEERQRPRPDAHTSPVVGQEPGGRAMLVLIMRTCQCVMMQQLISQARSLPALYLKDGNRHMLMRWNHLLEGRMMVRGS